MNLPEKIKLTLETNKNKHTSEINWDANLEDLLDSFYGLCVATTYDPITVCMVMKKWSETKCNNFEYFFNKSKN
jgi:hypothetical protein